MQYASSAMRTCRALRSTSLKTATERMDISRSVRAMRTAISPRLAMRTLSNMSVPLRHGTRRGRSSQRDPRRGLKAVVDAVGLVGKLLVAGGVERAGRNRETKVFFE